MRITKLSAIILFISFHLTMAQTSQTNGLRDNTPEVFAFENARIYVSSGNIINKGRLIIRDGLIEEVGEKANIPADAWIYDLDGKTIYPGFIELYSSIGLPRIEQPDRREMQALGITEGYEELMVRFLSGSVGEKTQRGAYHWSPHVRSWYDAAEHLSYDEEEARRLRSQGFSVVHTIAPYGIFKGRTAIISLGEGSINELVVRTNVAQALSFIRSQELGTGYPSSLMGVISLIRQTFHDSKWYLKAHNEYYENPLGSKKPEKNLALASLIEVAYGRQPVIFSVDDEIALMRALNIAREFDLNLWIKGSGKEYRRLDVITGNDFPVIVPLDFPKKPDVDSFDKTIELSLETLMHWELAPENPVRIYETGATMVLTSAGTQNNKEFLKHLRSAVERGLPEYAALDALTINPAQLLQIDQTHGTLAKGKKADFIVTDGNIFDAETKIIEMWIDGKKYPVDKPPELTAQGVWQLTVNDTLAYELKLKGTVGDYKGKLFMDDKDLELKNVRFDKQRISFQTEDFFSIEEGIMQMSAQVSERSMYGIGEMTSGKIFNWKAEKISDIDVEDKPDDNNEDKDEVVKAISSVLYPPMDYGFSKIPGQASCLLVRNATIWTQGQDGIIKKGDMLVRNGKISEVGTNVRVPGNCEIIDASGKHVTPGLIDPHLHTGISGGVNETVGTITSETRIRDVLNSNNIWIYRLLAGGLTTANILHGSANPVGGQDAVIKMRWGSLPDEMIFEEAKPGLKMALGENVKGLQNRYPNTRMGTEQIIRDAFEAALDYRRERDEKQRYGLPYRKDLQMEALLEVLEGKRLVHAHAYRHDEMIKLMRIAENFGFKITSFEHSVEGYKIADLLREHGAAAIVWTDWSSFKMEAYDAIIYNARLLSEQGVLTSLHSDNTRLATRMHWEAGKIAGTGVNETEALNMVTLNPAKILGIDHVTGSLEEDKHADFVIWSEHPLKGFAHAEQTWIDGRKYFDREKDRENMEEILKLKNRLINKVLNSTK